MVILIMLTEYSGSPGNICRYYYIAGTAIVLGIIAVCLFPLWPMEMRQGVYYLSVAAAGFLVFIIVLAIIKYIIFVLLFIFTAGKLKFWIFPNLTEDVGFFESFMPVYVYTYDKPKKDKDSDDEESSDEEEEEDDKGTIYFCNNSVIMYVE